MESSHDRASFSCVAFTLVTDIATLPESEDEFEFDVLSARIGAAVRLFLLHLDTCSNLLTHVGRTQDRMRKSPVEAAAAKRLPPDQRNEIDELVRRVIEEVPSMVEEVVESLMPDDVSKEFAVEEGSHHPLSDEENAALLNFLGTRGLYREIDKRFSRFQGDPIAITYIKSQVMEKARKSPSEVLAESLLPGVVSAFEQFLSALLRTGLAKHPYGLGELPDLPHREWSRLATKDDAERYLIDQKVHTVLAGGPNDWARDIKKWTKIELVDLGADWSAVRESIQRRHAIVHNGGKVDAEYLAKVDPELRRDAKLGAPLRCSAEYMSRMLENYRVLGLVLALRWAHHFGKLQPLEVLPDLVNEIYQLERADRWRAAYLISDTSVGLQGNDAPLDDYLQVNWWLCRKQLGMGSAEMTGDIYNWSPGDSEMKAARYALLEDDASLAASVREILGKSMSTLDRRQFKDQVIWDAAKGRSPEVRAAFAGKPASSRRKVKRQRRG